MNGGKVVDNSIGVMLKFSHKEGIVEVIEQYKKSFPTIPKSIGENKAPRRWTDTPSIGKNSLWSSSPLSGARNSLL
jgi:hypothetical protein